MFVAKTFNRFFIETFNVLFGKPSIEISNGFFSKPSIGYLVKPPIGLLLKPVNRFAVKNFNMFFEFLERF